MHAGWGKKSSVLSDLSRPDQSTATNNVKFLVSRCSALTLANGTTNVGINHHLGQIGTGFTKETNSAELISHLVRSSLKCCGIIFRNPQTRRLVGMESAGTGKSPAEWIGSF